MKARRSAILYFWNKGRRSPTAIYRITKTPLRTVKYNITKMKLQGIIEDRTRKDRPSRITASDSIALVQWIRRNNEAISNELAQKLLHDRALNVSKWTVQCELKPIGYKSTLSYGTPMLMQEQKYARLQWTIQHKDDDWSRTIFTDETFFAIPLVDGHKIQVLKFPKDKQKMMV